MNPPTPHVTKTETDGLKRTFDCMIGFKSYNVSTLYHNSGFTSVKNKNIYLKYSQSHTNCAKEKKCFHIF